MRRRLRQTGGRARKLRGLIELLTPYKWRVLAMFVALVSATAAALAPAPLAKLAIDDGIRRHDVGALDLIVAAFLVSALVYAVASYAQTYLVGWVGQRALQDLRVRLFSHLQQPVDRLLLAQPRRRDHLPADQRRRGARPAGRGRDRHAVPVGADADRRRGDPARARLPPGAAHLPRDPDPVDRGRGLPDRLGRRLPADAREDRHDHRLPAGDAVGHPRGPGVRPGAAAHRAVP